MIGKSNQAVMLGGTSSYKQIDPINGTASSKDTYMMMLKNKD